MPNITLGNDIASYQGDVNYDVFKNNSQFVIVKATEGTGFTDPKFKRNQSEARRVGILLGYYHFARPDLKNTPQAEAQWFLSQLGDIKDGELLVLDYEPNWPGGDAVGWCKSFLDYVFDKTKCRPLIYLNQSQTKGFNWKPVVDANYGLWIAAYTYDPNKNDFVTGAWPGAAMQQWSNRQQVPGINGNVDGNVFFGDLATLKKYGFKSATPAPTPTPTPTPQPEPTPAPQPEDKYSAEAQLKSIDVSHKENTGHFKVNLNLQAIKNGQVVANADKSFEGDFALSLPVPEPVPAPTDPDVITKLDQKINFGGFGTLTLEDAIKKMQVNQASIDIAKQGKDIKNSKNWWWVKYGLWNKLFS